jgi:hypothetical protein
MPTRPISEQVVAMSVEWKGGDRTSESTKPERLPVVVLRRASGSRLTETNPATVASETIDHEVGPEIEVEKEAMVVDVQVRRIGDNNYSFSFNLGFSSRVHTKWTSSPTDLIPSLPSRP